MVVNLQPQYAAYYEENQTDEKPFLSGFFLLRFLRQNCSDAEQGYAISDSLYPPPDRLKSKRRVFPSIINPPPLKEEHRSHSHDSTTLANLYPTNDWGGKKTNTNKWRV